MARYLTEQVENGTPYNDILEVHNRLIAVGKAIRFFYHFIKDYTIQLANKYSIDLDWTGIPDDVEFNHDWLQEGDVVDYLNDLVNAINTTKDMLNVALGQYTTFFQKWLDILDEDNDSLSSMVVGDNDIHNKPEINYDKLFLSWNVGDVVYAEDFNQLKEHAHDLIKALPRIFGAYYHLIELEGLDTKSNAFGDYGVSVTDSALTFSNLISDWTKVEPYAPESGATVFHSYYDGHRWNRKVVVWKSADETAHRFMIWNYFTQEYEFDSGWYPAQDWITPTAKPSNFDYWYSGSPSDLKSIIISSDYSKISYAWLKYGMHRRTNGDDGLLIQHSQKVIDLESMNTTDLQNYYSNIDDGCDTSFEFKFSLRGRHVLSVVLNYQLTDSGGDDDQMINAYYVNANDSSIKITHLYTDDYMGEIETRTDAVTHLGTGAITFHWEMKDDDGWKDHIYGCYYISSDGMSISRTYRIISDNPSYDYTTFFRKYPAAIIYGNRENDDWYGHTAVTTSLGTADHSIYWAGGFQDADTSNYHKFIYGMALAWGYKKNDDGGTYYTTLRIDYPKYVYRGSSDPGRVGYNRSDEYIKIDWDYPKIKWLIPYDFGYTIQNPRVFEDTTTVDSSNKAYFVAAKYFVPKTWYGVPVLETPDSFAREDGTLPIRFHYWGLDSDKLSTYDTLIIEVN